MTARLPLRPLLASALLALLVSPALAAEVSAKDAARAAAAWVDRGYAMGKLPAGRTVAGVDEVEDPATGAQLRVVRFEGGGFVVLSADDLVDPVLAFSETGDGLDLDERNPFWALLRGDIAAREAAAGVERGGKAATKGGGTATRGAKSSEPTAAQAKWAALLADEEAKPQKRGAVAAPSDLRVDSFVESRWNQQTASGYLGSTDYCYNYYTPNHYYSGCVATALSQMMWYFGYPTNPVAQASYPCAVDGDSRNEFLMGGVYDWASMPARPWETGTTEAQRKAIGKLVHDAGAAVGMMWGAGGSTASIFTGQSALQVDFGYAQACAIPYISAYPWSLETFRRNVVPCLDARSPVGISISAPPPPGETTSIGHAVLADGYGYSSDGFCLHINFGWGYAADSQTAWYCPPDLATDATNAFDTIDGILCNIFPDRTGSVFSGRVLDGNGNPVFGATVVFSDQQQTTTDANGVYAFVAPAGSYVATAYKEGKSASVAGTLTQTLPVTPTGRTRYYSYGTISCGNSPDNDIVLNGLESAPAPVFSPPSCLFYPSTNVTIDCPDSGASIYYTIDGSTPTENSIPYTGPITVSDTVTIKARAFSPGKNASLVVSETYTYDAAAAGPQGDFFSSPIQISGMSGTRVVTDNSMYTIEAGEPPHTLVVDGNGYSQYDEAHSIWYLWTAPGSGTMTFSAMASDDWPFLAVYTGDSLSSLNRIALETEGYWSNGGYVSVDVEVVQGGIYRIVGMTYDEESSGSFTLSWSGNLTVVKTPYETWADEQTVVLGGPEEVTGGVANLFRYVFDRPTGSFSPILSALPGPSDGSILRLSRVFNTNGLTLKVVSTTNVADWTAGAIDERVITVGPTVGAEQPSVELPVGGPARFFRLKAELEATP